MTAISRTWDAMILKIKADETVYINRSQRDNIFALCVSDSLLNCCGASEFRPEMFTQSLCGQIDDTGIVGT